MPDQNHGSKKISTQLKILKLMPLNYLIPLASNYLKLNPIIWYILSYQMLVWDFRKSNYMSIRKVINKINWEFFLSNKNVHDQVSAFNSTSVNFFSNYILIRYLTSMKNIIRGWQGKLRTTLLKKQYIWTWSYDTKLHDMNNILLLLSIVVIISSEFSGLLKKRKEKYHNHISVKLSNIQASAKTYWSILKTFYNGNNIPIYTSIKTNILLTTTITITVCYYHATYEF